MTSTYKKQLGMRHVQYQPSLFINRKYTIQLKKMDNLNLELDKQFHIPNSTQDDTYYHEYVRLYLANIALTSQVKQLVEEKNQLITRLSRYQDEDGYSSYEKHTDKNKRFRRTAHEIQRFYKCCVKSCQKSYGSQGSLNQHYKLKHPEIYVTLPSVISGKTDNQEQQTVPAKSRQPLKLKEN